MLKTVTVIAVALPLLLHGTLAEGFERPNIVFILADDLGYGTPNCYGSDPQLVQTPNIDRLAEEGMRFTDAHSPSSVCTPSRYNLLTGRYAWRTWAGSSGVWANDPLIIEPGRITVASLLKQKGYHTAIVGKWHLGFGRPGEENWATLRGVDYNGEIKPGPLECGFDYFFGIPHVGQYPHILIEGHHIIGLEPDDPIELLESEAADYRVPYLQRPRNAARNPNLKFRGGEAALYEHHELADILTERAVEVLEERAEADEPFFLYFAHRNPHRPLAPHPRFLGTSGCGKYGDFIHELDWSVGKVLNTLDRLGMAENTLVFLSSDNGGVSNYREDRAEINGLRINGILRGQKTEVFEGGHRVPFLARWPGRIEAASASDRLIALTDILATLAELLDTRLPDNAGEDSFSFLSALTGGQSDQPARTSLVHDSFRGLKAIRKGKWKLIPAQGGGGFRWNKNDRNPELPAGMLFNVKSDLAETENLYETRRDVVADLTIVLDDVVRSGGSRPRKTKDVAK